MEQEFFHAMFGLEPKSSGNFLLTDLGAWKTPENKKSSGQRCLVVGMATFHATFSSLRGAWRPSGTVSDC